MRVGQQAETLNLATEEAQIFVIFPNPVDDKLTTKFSLVEVAKVNFDIVDIQGRIIESYQYKGEAGVHTFIIDVSKLNEGSYILRGMLGNKMEIRKFIVER